MCNQKNNPLTLSCFSFKFMAFGEDHNAVLLRAMSIANGVDMVSETSFLISRATIYCSGS